MSIRYLFLIFSMLAGYSLSHARIEIPSSLTVSEQKAFVDIMDEAWSLILKELHRGSSKQQIFWTEVLDTGVLESQFEDLILEFEDLHGNDRSGLENGDYSAVAVWLYNQVILLQARMNDTNTGTFLNDNIDLLAYTMMFQILVRKGLWMGNLGLMTQLHGQARENIERLHRESDDDVNESNHDHDDVTATATTVTPQNATVLLSETLGTVIQDCLSLDGRLPFFTQSKR